jgi:hypothetical protein
VARVYATTPGAEVWISHYGPATETVPCVVPEAVGVELAKVEGFRVELDEPAPLPVIRKKNAAAAPAEAKVKED